MTTALSLALISLAAMSGAALFSGAATLGIADHIGNFWLDQRPQTSA